MSEFKEKAEEIREKVKTHGLIMSRVPDDTRDFFIKLAENHFADDYGLTLTFLVDEFQRRSILENLDIKLNYVISLMENEKDEKKPQPRKIKTVDGKEKIIEKEEN